MKYFKPYQSTYRADYIWPEGTQAKKIDPAPCSGSWLRTKESTRPCENLTTYRHDYIDLSHEKLWRQPPPRPSKEDTEEYKQARILYPHLTQCLGEVPPPELAQKVYPDRMITTYQEGYGREVALPTEETKRRALADKAKAVAPYPLPGQREKCPCTDVCGKSRSDGDLRNRPPIQPRRPIDFPSREFDKQFQSPLAYAHAVMDTVRAPVPSADTFSRAGWLRDACYNEVGKSEYQDEYSRTAEEYVEKRVYTKFGSTKKKSDRVRKWNN